MTKDDFRKWIFNNKEQLEDAIQAKLSNIRYFTDAPSEMRPDLYTEEEQTCYRIAVMVTLNKITDRDFVKLITVASFNDVKKAVWIVYDIDKKTQFMLEWLNDVIDGNVEFILLKLSAYQLDNSRIENLLVRLEELEVTIDYRDFTD